MHARNLLAGFTEIMGGEPKQVYEGAGAPLFAVVVSPDGRLLAASGEKGTLVVFNVESGQLIKRLEGHDKNAGQFGAVYAVAFHPQGKWLASAGEDKRIIFWSVPAGEKLREWEAPNKVLALAVSPDGTQLASGGEDKAVTLWDAETGKKLRTLEGHSEWISEGGLAFSPTGERLASASCDDTARLWEVSTGESLQVLRGHTNKVQRITFSPDGKQLATSSNDQTIRLWDAESGRPLRVLTGHQNVVFGLRFVADGRTLVSASRDRTLRLWDIESGVTLRVLRGHSAGATGIDTHAGQVFSASLDGAVHRWEVTLPHRYIVDLPNGPASAAIVPQRNSVAVGFSDGALRLYSLPDGRLLWEQERAHTSRLQRLAFTADGGLLASASFDNTAKLWEVREGTLHALQTFEGHTDAVRAVAFSPDEETLATAGYDGQVGLFKVGTEQRRSIEKAHDECANDGCVQSVAFDATGTRLLSSGYNDRTTRLWNLNSDPPTLLQEFPKAQDMLMWATLSPDGQRVASVGRDQLVHIYATQDGREQHRLVGHENTILRVVFSPDSQQAATVSSDATVRLWDLSEGRELFSLRLPTNSGWPVPLWDFDFRCTPEGTCWIAVPLTRGKLVLYELPYESVQDRAEDLRAQYSVWESYIRLIDMQLQQNRPQAALQTSQEALEISKRLTEKDPGSFLARRSVMVSQWKTGQVQQALKNPEPPCRPIGRLPPVLMSWQKRSLTTPTHRWTSPGFCSARAIFSPNSSAMRRRKRSMTVSLRLTLIARIGCFGVLISQIV